MGLAYHPGTYSNSANTLFGAKEKKSKKKIAPKLARRASQLSVSVSMVLVILPEGGVGYKFSREKILKIGLTTSNAVGGPPFQLGAQLLGDPFE